MLLDAPSERTAGDEATQITSKTCSDPIIERNAQFFGALDHVFAADGASKGLVFHPLLHRTGFKIKNALRRAHVRACRKEAGKLIAGKESSFKRGLPRNAGVVRVREYGADQFLAVAALAKDFCAFGGVLAVADVVIIGPALVVEIV